MPFIKNNMKIILNQKTEVFAKEVFNTLEQEKKGQGRLFLRKLKELFEKNGFFRLSLKQVELVAKSFVS